MDQVGFEAAQFTGTNPGLVSTSAAMHVLYLLGSDDCVVWACLQAIGAITALQRRCTYIGANRPARRSGALLHWKTFVHYGPICSHLYLPCRRDALWAVWRRHCQDLWTEVFCGRQRQGPFQPRCRLKMPVTSSHVSSFDASLCAGEFRISTCAVDQEPSSSNQPHSCSNVHRVTDQRTNVFVA